MPNYFVTFRAHSAEPQVFEDWMILLLKIVKRQKKFAYQVEWDETPSRHIHLLLYDKNDVSKIHQLFNNKQEKLFKNYLTNKLTIWSPDSDNQGFCNIILCDDNDPLKSTEYYLGYIHKHNCPRRGHSVDISSEIINDAVELYYTNKKLSIREEKNNDIKLITTKNIYSNLISFVNDPINETSFLDKSLKYKTVKNGHFGYCGISDKQEAKAFTELRIMKNCEQCFDESNCDKTSIDQSEHIDYLKYRDYMRGYNSMKKTLQKLIESDDSDFEIVCIKQKYGIELFDKRINEEEPEWRKPKKSSINL